jgi:hypothetical protein
MQSSGWARRPSPPTECLIPGGGVRYCRPVPTGGLDAEKVALLRGWGEGLERDSRHEVAAAGRAILMLVEEIERLHVLIWDRQLYPEQPAVEVSSEPDVTELGKSLLRRVREQLARPDRSESSTDSAAQEADFHR